MFFVSDHTAFSPLRRHGWRWVLLGSALVVLLSACVSRGDQISIGRYQSKSKAARGYPVSVVKSKNHSSALWISGHPRVQHFRRHYLKTRTVEKALERGSFYLPAIAREFRSRGLPMELAYLPMLESLFDKRANSGSALGMWQFTRQTAKEVGLRVRRFSDERLNWRKSTAAAANYLDTLGARFQYDWALTLAAYNGGPGYMEAAIKRQGERNFWRLRLRKETSEYVPRFIAMLQVAREKYPHLLAAR